jgi:hypothetical protein
VVSSGGMIDDSISPWNCKCLFRWDDSEPMSQWNCDGLLKWGDGKSPCLDCSGLFG